MYGMWRDPQGGRRFLLLAVGLTAFVLLGGFLLGRASDTLGFVVVLAIAAAVIAFAIGRPS